jgi:transposase InsO family protein
MNTHKNARLTPYLRREACRRVAARVKVAQVARDLAVSRQTIYAWLQGPDDVETRSSRPHRSPTRLKRRLPRVEPPQRIVRYERDRPGELVHLDVKKLGRIGVVDHRIHGDYTRRARGRGWEYVHVAIDDHTRLSYSEVLPDETATTALGFLTRAVAWYAALGIAVERVLTDNGSCYRGRPFAEGAIALGISQRFTRPYRPQTNGNAERFIRTLLNEWAYARAYGRSGWRTRALPHYLSFYNTERRHSALGDRTPAARLALYLSTTC